jgi:hypothetical protein
MIAVCSRLCDNSALPRRLGAPRFYRSNTPAKILDERFTVSRCPFQGYSRVAVLVDTQPDFRRFAFPFRGYLLLFN